MADGGIQSRGVATLAGGRDLCRDWPGARQDRRVIHGVVAERGGVAPVARCRSRWALTLPEREEISRGLCAGESIRQMARRLGRAPSSLSREIARHGGRHRYRALQAEAWRNAQRPKVCRLA